MPKIKKEPVATSARPAAPTATTTTTSNDQFNNNLVSKPFSLEVILTWTAEEGEETGRIANDDDDWRRQPGERQARQEGKGRAQLDLLLEEGEPGRHLWPVR